MSKHIFRFSGVRLIPAAESGEITWQIIEASEISHLRNSLQLQVGATVEVFDGLKAVACLGQIISVTKKAVLVKEIRALISENNAHPFAIALGTLQPKHFEEVLPFLCELGTGFIFSFDQMHTAKFKTKSIAAASTLNHRYHRIIASSCKQSKRISYPVLEHYGSLIDLLAQKKERFEIFSLQKEGKAKASNFSSKPPLFIIGSESGFTLEEDALLEDFPRISLGTNVLRAVTAAVTVAGIASAGLF